MAISRMQQPRQMYGLGSFVKKAVRKVTKPFTKVAKKIVPREVAGIMRAAAPFLPAGYREAAYLLGTAKQTGRISPVDLALTLAPTVGRMTTPGGQTVAQRLGGIDLPFTERSLGEVLVGSPAEYEARIGSVTENIMSGEGADRFLDTQKTFFRDPKLTKEATSGIFGKGGKMFQFGKPGGPGILDTKAGQTLFGKETDKGFQFSPLKLGSIGVSALSLIQNSKTPDEAGKALAASTGDSADYDRGYALFSQLTPELFAVPERFRMDAQGGGRIGFRQGTPKRGLGSMAPDMIANPTAGLGALGDMADREFKFDAQEFMINKYKEDGTKPNIIGEGFQGDDRIFVIETPNFGSMVITLDQYLENFGIPERKITKADGGLMRTNYAMGSGDDDDKPVLPEDPTKPVNPFGPKPIKPLGDMKMASSDSYQNYVKAALSLGLKPIRIDEFESLTPIMDINEILNLTDELNKRISKKEGGRANLALGTKPTPEESGLGGLPIEADMRYTGGFMPYGAKEKADDVPARLSKNEFVFTADAVRAAGGGSVNEGAKKMYQTMKQLEAKPEAKGMMA